MTSSTLTGDGVIVPRALAALEARRAQLMPLLGYYLIAGSCCLGIVGAACAEFFSAGVGFHAAFPMKSDGTSLASDLMSLRYPIILCLLFGDVLLHSIPGRFGAVINRLLDSIGLGAIALLLFGVGAFMFSATFLTLGSEDGQGFVGHLVGLALGTASASMFTLSFLASHVMLSKLFAVIPVIVSGRAERAKIAGGNAAVKDFDAHCARAKSLRATCAAMDPDALKQKTANECGKIAGMVAAELHDLCASRAVLGDTKVEPQDHSEVPDVPLAVLEQRYADLQRYTVGHFLNVLKQKEA